MRHGLLFPSCHLTTHFLTPTGHPCPLQIIRSAERPSPLMKHHRHAHPGIGSNEGAEHPPAPVLHPLQGQNPREDVTGHGPLQETLPIVGKQTNAPVMATGDQKETRASFFRPAQLHVGESVPLASAPTTIRISSAKAESYGTAQSDHPEKTNRETSSPQMGSHCVSTGTSPRAACPRSTASGTDVLGAESQTTEPRLVLEQKRLKATSPYAPDVWWAELTRLGLLHRYPFIIEGFKHGFNLGIPTINNTYIPPNHQSISRDPILSEVYNSTVVNEFALGRYVGPFTREQLETELGPFQTSPLSFVPKASKPGKYRAVHNFSFPHTPSLEVASINSHINSEDFPCTWGTFATVALLIARLPPGSQASVRDVAEAYRTIPANPAQWPGLVIRLQTEDQFAVNVCNNFGLSSAGGVYGTVADAGTDIFRGNGMGPISKWVDDHIFFRIPRQHLPAYNSSRAQWSHEIQLHGGRQQEGGRLWYKGKNLPSGHPEEFDEDCRVPFLDLAEASPRSAEDEPFAYADPEIDALSERLGIRWEPSKSVPFGTEVPYLGFLWNLHERTVCLLEKKRIKYLAAISQWKEKRTHNLLETQQLHGKLLHASLVLPPGRAYLTSLEAMLGCFHHNVFIPRTPPRDTPSDLEWWERRLSQPSLPRPIPIPSPLVDYEAYSDASSGVGIAITIGSKWRAWRLSPKWKSQGRDIQWAEAVGFELLVRHLLTVSKEGEHIKVHGDNRGVVEGWWKKSSANVPTNKVFRRILEASESNNRTIYTRYIPSAENPADAPSRGRYPPRELLLDDIGIPEELHPFLTGVGPRPSSQNSRVETPGTSHSL